MRFRFFAVAFSLLSLFSPHCLMASINSGTSEILNNKSSISQSGIGLSLGAKFNLVEDIFTDAQKMDYSFLVGKACCGSIKSSKKKLIEDHIFTEVEVFGNRFFSGKIDHNFGGRMNIGYEIHNLSIYGSGGYVIGNFNDQQIDNAKRSLRTKAPFVGVGIGYEITKNIGIRLNSMFYNFNYKTKDSEYANAKVSVSAFNLGLSLHF
jgi:hypothetical protein